MYTLRIICYLNSTIRSLSHFECKLPSEERSISHLGVIPTVIDQPKSRDLAEDISNWDTSGYGNQKKESFII